MANKIIITGGQGTGKSTLINALSQKGFCCFEEVSRLVIREQASVAGGIFPWNNLMERLNFTLDRLNKQRDFISANSN